MVTELTHSTAVAVIDDEESMREGCRQTLTEEGYSAAVAEDGQQGLTLVERIKPAVVLVDLVMPGMSGLQVLEKIREIDPFVVTVVITGYGTIESAVGAMRTGAFDYLTKPFESEKLLDVVSRGLDRYRTQKRLAEQEDEQKQAGQNFAAILCHELRSPAAVAAQCIEAVTEEPGNVLSPKQESMLNRAYQRVTALTELVEDWLKLAQIEAGALRFEPKPVELPPLIEEAWNTIPDTEARSRISLELQVIGDVKPVRGEEGLLRELFANLFANSIKFTLGPGKVTVELRPSEKSTVVSVSDTGIGVAPEELAHLFEPFYRGPGPGLGEASGTGLGLAVVKSIVSVHRGTISVTSIPGQGTTFTLGLPAAQYVSTVPPVPVSARLEPAAIVELGTKVLSALELSSFVERMISEQTVIGVKSKEGAEDRFVFGLLESPSQLRLDYDVTILPPKKYLLPPRETLVKFKLGPSPTAAPHVEAPPRAVMIGVHPYDMIAINQLDRLMSETNPDPNYIARREGLTIIGVDPVRASEKAFWGAMGCDVVEDGFDLWLTDIGDGYVVEVGSENGASLLEKYADFRDATDQDFEARSRLREKLKDLGRTREVRFRPTELPNLLRRSFGDNIWEQNARKCLSCGSCNLLCPTCYCFDVRDDVDISLNSGDRYRVWDGCVLKDFAKVATGENFREKRVERYRHRFYRKGMYLYDKYGYIACVGCGRCASACLSDVADPVTVYNALKENNHR